MRCKQRHIIIKATPHDQNEYIVGDMCRVDSVRTGRLVSVHVKNTGVRYHEDEGEDVNSRMRQPLLWRFHCLCCGRLQGGVRGVVIEGRYVAACWLHPQAINGLPPLNEGHLRTINQSAGWLKGEVSGWARREGGELAARKLTPCALERRRTELDYCIGLLCTDRLYGELFWSWTLDCTFLIMDYGTLG